jgi:hypothetical protein
MLEHRIEHNGIMTGSIGKTRDSMMNYKIRICETICIDWNNRPTKTAKNGKSGKARKTPEGSTKTGREGISGKMTDLENALNDFRKTLKEFDARLLKLEQVMGIKAIPVVKPNLLKFLRELEKEIMSGKYKKT